MRRLQSILLILIAFISVISSPRVALYEEVAWIDLPKDFSTINISIPDIFLIALVFVTALCLIISANYRKSLLNAYQQGTVLVWVGMMLWAGVSQVWAINPLFSQAQALHILACLVMVIVIIEQRSPTPIMMAFVASAVIQSGVAIVQILNQNPLGLGTIGEVARPWYEPSGFYRASGLAMHSNYLAGYLLIGLGCAVALWMTTQKRRTIWVICGLIIAFGMGCSLSRSGYVGMFVLIAPLIVWGLMRLSPQKRLVAFIGLGAGIALASTIGFVVLLNGDWENVQTRFFSGREFYFEDSWQVITQHPVIGAGAGNIMVAVSQNITMTYWDRLPVHHVYLFIWAELGVIGMGIFILACLMTLWSFRPRQNPTMRVWFTLWLAICVVMLFDNYWWGVQPFRIMLFLVLALGITARETYSIGTGTGESG